MQGVFTFMPGMARSVHSEIPKRMMDLEKIVERGYRRPLLRRHDRVSSRTPGKRVYAEDSTKVFLTVGLTHALTYGCGMNGHPRGLFRLLDRLCREGGADDNMCVFPTKVLGPINRRKKLQPALKLGQSCSTL